MLHRLILLTGLSFLLLCGAIQALAEDPPLKCSESSLTVTTKNTKSTTVDESDFFADDEYREQDSLISDPLYGFNLVMFHFNDALYSGVLSPLAKGYAWAVPPRPRQLVHNFFTNALFPVRFVNDLLQGKFDAAYMETSKFIANTSFGFLGLVDVTENRPHLWEPEKPTADGFDQTLGKAGFGQGCYIVWPIFGPSSIRGTVGIIGDTALDPFSYADLTFRELSCLRAYQNINKLSLNLQNNEYATVTAGAIDKYEAVRNAYIRFRTKKIAE